MQMKLETKWTADTASSIYADALKVRHDVFVLEQGVPVEEEVDDLEDQTHHVVIYEKDVPVATARILELADNTYKVQRVAVQKDFRGQGYGATLMEQVEIKARELGGTTITLGAQNTAIPFYEKLNYTVEGDEFMDAGIPHHTMTKNL